MKLTRRGRLTILTASITSCMWLGGHIPAFWWKP